MFIASASPVCCIVMFCPSNRKSNVFPKFSNFMADVVARYDKVIMAGDFNFPIDDATNNFDQITF